VEEREIVDETERERKRYVSNVNLVTNYHCIFIFSSKNLALKIAAQRQFKLEKNN
jgi:hypothetical protein